MSAGLTAAELAGLATDLAADPDRWSAHVRHDPRQRIFHKVLATDEVCAWLICWMPGHDTGFHDHDGSAGAVAVVAGPGELLRFGPHDIHRVVHHGNAPAVTLHVYSPVLRRMGQYELDDEGRLLRVALDEDQELTAAV